MVARLRLPRWIGWGRSRTDAIERTVTEESARRPLAPSPVEIDIAPNDPLIAYFQSSAVAMDLDDLKIDSPAVDALRSSGVKLVVPLVSQGELIGLLNLGPRLSEQEYSVDDHRLLNNLSAQAAPAVRVAQLVQEQQAEARERERIEQEMRVAQLIQQQFLPQELPELPGWQIAARYQPARAVGGDFYDVFELPNGEVGIVAGDVTDKGVPAALVMASTRSLLRADAPRLVSPSAVLARVNDLLFPSIPARMFVTCIYAVLNPETGHFRYANAGHNLPYLYTEDGVVELRATGMPLGLMPGMSYEESETTLVPGQSMLLYSDGLIEAHDEQGEMFGFPRLKTLMEEPFSSHDLIDKLMTELDPLHRIRPASKRTTSRWSLYSGRPSSTCTHRKTSSNPRARQSSEPRDAFSPISRSAASRVTSASRWRRSPRQSRRSTCRATSWIGSARRSPRPP